MCSIKEALTLALIKENWIRRVIEAYVSIRELQGRLSIASDRIG